MSDAGHIIGASQVSVGTGEPFHAFLVPNGGALPNQGIDLGTLGGDNSVAYDVEDLANNSGINKLRIVGASEMDSTLDPTFLWPADTYHLKQYLPFGKTGAGRFHAFNHVGSTPLTLSDDMGTFGGGNSVAYAANHQNVVVGTAQTGIGEYRAFRHNGSGVLSLADDIHDSIQFSASVAYGVNNLGPANNPPVVGMGLTIAGGVSHAFLYLPEQNFGLPSPGTYDLSDMASAFDPSWTTLIQATGIRIAGDNGNKAVIVGTGIRNGQYRGFIMVLK